MNTLGPSTMPSSIAVFRPQSLPPASRTVVKPRISIRRAAATAFVVSSVSGMPSRSSGARGSRRRPPEKR